jgi:hypothetical protein
MQWPRDRRIYNGVMQLVSRQRIGKHVPTATNSQVAIELLLETVFSTRSVRRGYKGDNWGDPSQFSCILQVRLRRDGAIVQLIVQLAGRWPAGNGVSAWSWRISAVESCYQATTREDYERVILSVCCSDLWIVDISFGAVVICSSELCVQVFNKFIHQSKPCLWSHIKVTVFLI